MRRALIPIALALALCAGGGADAANRTVTGAAAGAVGGAVVAGPVGLVVGGVGGAVIGHHADKHARRAHYSKSCRDGHGHKAGCAAKHH